MRRVFLSLFITLIVFGSGCNAVTPTPVPTLTPTSPLMATPTPFPTPTSMPIAEPMDPTAYYEEAMIPAARGDLLTLDDPPHYDIALNIDMEELTIVGEEKVTYTNNEDVVLEEVCFRLFPNAREVFDGRGLEVSAVMVNGQEVQPSFELDDTVMRVSLPEFLPPEGRIEISMDFVATIPQDPVDRANYGIYNYAEGVIALANCYPILAVYDDEGWNLDPVINLGDAVYSDTALYTVSITAPEEAVIVASGSEIKTVLNDDGTKTAFYRSGPMRDFFIALSKEFEVMRERVGDTTVNSYYLSNHRSGGEKALQFAVNSLRFYNQHFGTYPFSELDVVEVPLGVSGVEYPGLILIDDRFYVGEGEGSFELVVAHEVAHQWWYSVVGNDVIDEPWLDEALVTYSSLLYMESAHGEHYADGMRSYFQERCQKLVEEERDAPVAQPVYSFEGWEQYGTIVYLKGALFFDALREEVGDEVYFEIMRRYYEEYKYDIATPNDLMRIAEEVSGKDLDELYRRWILTAE